MEPSAGQSILVLKQLGAFLQSLSPEQVEDLAAGRSRISLVRTQAPREAKTSRRGPSVDLEQLRLYLSGAESREVGEEYLKKQKLSRADLQALARVLDIPVRKGDNMDAIRESVVEATIGYRLRSDAIRGNAPTEGDAN
ncbi:hypothetical protein ACWDQO_11360 [Streptomyces sp. NPDC003703]|uniref:hypothetical protein n=1 Tax=Streptomyces sp. NPDC003283 TaxID=3364681 RepID=UPI0036B732A8